MTHEKILKRAVSKAINNGWDFFGEDIYSMELESDHITFPNLSDYSVFEIIFSHDFAKTFWNENDYGWTKEKVEETKRLYPGVRVAEWGTLPTDYNWQYHLQQMVLEENPITYLKKFI